MNFTREPIIETIITPKEGFRLQVRNSKGGGQEEYLVDSVEVVSFGHSFFFRSLEKPRSFLVPVSDYEIVEVKEARIALKHAGPERAIKISGGREASFRPQREPAHEKAEVAAEEREEEGAEQQGQPAQGGQPREGRRRDRRRHRRRRGDRYDMQEGEGRPEAAQEVKEITPPESGAEGGGGASDETKVSSSMFTSLFPPPPTLISETISRYKEKDSGLSEGGFFPKPIEEEERLKHVKKEEEDEDVSGDSPDSEGSSLSRVATTSMSFVQETSFTSITPPFSDYRS